jgi:trehalose/maltose hydrolase-like predicted phosphorylase
MVDEFSLTYDRFDPSQEGLREALTSTGNGCFCIRGAAEWEDPDDVHYPGTYAHGVYNHESTIAGGRVLPHEELVNLPRLLSLKLRIGGGEPVCFAKVELLTYRHVYNIRDALLTRELRFRDSSGRETRLTSRRFVSMGRMHLAALAWELVAENWSGRVELVSALDGRTLNRGQSPRHQLGRHLDPQGSRFHAPDVIGLEVRTRQSRIEIAGAARTRVYGAGEEPAMARSTYQTDDYVHQTLAFDLQRGKPARVEKMVALYTSRDRGINEPLANATKSADRYPRFDEALEGHREAWSELWEVCDIRLPRDPRTQFRLRLHISHLLQTCSRLTPHHDAGLPARGLNGEANRGHVFWDELYAHPFLSYRLPEVARGLLMYRYRRIGEARASAQKAGFRGAMYPWQSGSDGEEETQLVRLNPSSGRWEPDLSHNQRHVNAAIFYSVWQHYQITHDIDFLRDHGAEMMLDIARFWSSAACFNRDRDRWEIHGVMGPDGFHESYATATDGGLRNNAYTNVMAAWICGKALDVLDLLPASRRDVLRARLGLTDDELGRWDAISRRMYVPFHRDGVISQFEGYENLEELDWDRYRASDNGIQDLDRILRAEGDDPARYKVSGQADTVMLFFAFSAADLRRIFARLGYQFTADLARRTIDFYDRRTSHDCALSLVTSAGALAATDPDRSWELFVTALESDIGDLDKDSVKDGIHLGVMAGTLDLVQRIYLGTEIRDDVLHLNPVLADRLDGLSLPMQVRGTPIVVSLSRAELTVTVLSEGVTGPVKICVGGQLRELSAGRSATFHLPSRRAD